MIKGKWFITPHAAKRFAELFKINDAEAFEILVAISEQAKFVKKLPSGASLYRLKFKPTPNPDQPERHKNRKQKKNSRRISIGLIVADPQREEDLPSLVTVLWKNWDNLYIKENSHNFPIIKR